jgi:hypothetical protein
VVSNLLTALMITIYTRRMIANNFGHVQCTHLCNQTAALVSGPAQVTIRTRQ